MENKDNFRKQIVRVREIKIEITLKESRLLELSMEERTYRERERERADTFF